MSAANICGTCRYIAPVKALGDENWYCDVYRGTCAERLDSTEPEDVPVMVNDAQKLERKVERWRSAWLIDIELAAGGYPWLGWRPKENAVQCPGWRARRHGRGPGGTGPALDRVDMVDAVFPARLRAEMTRLHIRVADMARTVGVTQNTVILWRTGKVMPRANYLAALAVELNSTMDWLLGLED